MSTPKIGNLYRMKNHWAYHSFYYNNKILLLIDIDRSNTNVPEWHTLVFLYNNKKIRILEDDFYKFELINE